MSTNKKWQIPTNIKVNSQQQGVKKPAFKDDIVNEEFGDEIEGSKRSSILHHLKRKEKPAGIVAKKKKPRKPRAPNGHLSVLS
jgi:hypothetical protein